MRRRVQFAVSAIMIAAAVALTAATLTATTHTAALSHSDTVRIYSTD